MFGIVVFLHAGGQDLAFDHPGEFAAEIIEVIVSSLFHQATIFQDEYRITVSDGGKTVGYKKDCLVAAQGVNAVLDFYLGFSGEALVSSSKSYSSLPPRHT